MQPRKNAAAESATAESRETSLGTKYFRQRGVYPARTRDACISPVPNSVHSECRMRRPAIHASPPHARYALALLAAVCLAVVPSKPSQADPDNSFVFMEVHAGAGWAAGLTDVGPGFATRALLGAGGKWTGFPLRLFGFVTAGLWQHEGLGATGAGQTSIDRAFYDLGGGARLLWPVWGEELRMHVDVWVGYGAVISEVRVGPLERYDTEVGDWMVGLGAGLQYRMIPWLSLGARFDWSGVFVGDNPDFAGTVAGLDKPTKDAWGRYGLTFSTTLHF